MKKGPVILIVVGIAIVLAIYLLPVTPTVEGGEPDSIEALETTTETEATDTHEGHDHAVNVEAEVQRAVESLSDTTKPPMQAIMRLRQLAEEHPDNISANFTLGLLSMRTAQYDNAVTRFDKVLVVAPQNVDAHAMKAQAYSALGKKEEAKQALEKAIEFAEADRVEQLQEALKELNSN